MIRAYFNNSTPYRKKLADCGRYTIARAARPVGRGEQKKAIYGLFIGDGNCTAMSDQSGILLSFEEMRRLSMLLPVLLKDGGVCEYVPSDEYAAAVAAWEAERKRPAPIW